VGRRAVHYYASANGTIGLADEKKAGFNALFYAHLTNHETLPKSVGRLALGKQQVQLTLRPDVDALLNQLAEDMHEDRSTIFKEAIIKHSEEVYRRFT
jgi:hypothetical protein